VVKFNAVLQPDPTGSGTFVLVPQDVQTKLELRGRPRIQAFIAGHPYRGSLMPMGDGTYCLGVLKAIQESAEVKRGDSVTVELALDNEPRFVKPPADLTEALAEDPNLATAWEQLSYTDKKEMARGLEEAKRADTRERRLNAALQRLRAGE
jgi:hypothetical protein